MLTEISTKLTTLNETMEQINRNLAFKSGLSQHQENPLLDATDLAVMFKKDVRTIRRWNKEGILNGVSINGNVYFLWADVLLVLQQNYTK